MTIKNEAIDAQFRAKVNAIISRDARKNGDFDRAQHFANVSAIEAEFARNMLDIVCDWWYDDQAPTWPEGAEQ